MKNAIFALVCIASSLASAAPLSPACYSQAEKAVAKFADEGKYDDNGFEANECSMASNKKAVICDVSASKGGGDAMDSYRVVLNSNCTKSFRVELTGEE